MLPTESRLRSAGVRGLQSVQPADQFRAVVNPSMAPVRSSAAITKCPDDVQSKVALRSLGARFLVDDFGTVGVREPT